jgi:hypothetical protein
VEYREIVTCADLYHLCVLTVIIKHTKSENGFTSRDFYEII